MSVDFGDLSARLRLPYLVAGQMQKHITLNEALTRLDLLVQTQVLSRTVTSQPDDPAEGVVYIVPDGATGAFWSLFDASQLARHEAGAWIAEAAPEGMLLHVADEDLMLVRAGGFWRPLSAPSSDLQFINRLGVNTEADAINPVSIRAPKVLVAAVETAEGGDGDLRLTLAKETAADVVSILFQSGFEGRAELGLIGVDDLSVKVSADGETWTEAITIDRQSGAVRLAGMGSVLRPETLAALTSMTTPLTRKRAFLLDDLVTDLMEAGVWDRLDLFYVMAAQDAQGARINLKSPGFGDLTAMGSPDFVRDRGYQGDGAAAYLRAGLSLSALQHFSLNDASLFAWSLTDVTNSLYGDAGVTSSSNTALFSRSAPGNLIVASNMTGALGYPVANSLGLSAWSRTGAASTTVYRNAQALGTASSASSVVGGGEVSLLRAGSNYSARRLAAAGLGAGFSAAQHSALHRALSTYLTGVGALS